MPYIFRKLVIAGSVLTQLFNREFQFFKEAYLKARLTYLRNDYPQSCTSAVSPPPDLPAPVSQRLGKIIALSVSLSLLSLYPVLADATHAKTVETEISIKRNGDSISSTKNSTNTVIKHEKPQTITLTFPGGDDMWRSSYTILLLSHALSYSDKTYHLRSGDASPKGRNFSRLAARTDINILWSMTRENREERFRPIRIPIFKGLAGWRVSLVHDSQQDVLKNVSSLAQLQKHIAGQMNVWTDAKILKSNQIPIQTGASYESLFKMLGAKRFDHFPRSVTEIIQEHTRFAHYGLSIDSNLALHYPTAMYYFVHKEDTAIAQDIEDGLNKALIDGSFDRLFWEFNGPLIKSLGIQKRQVIHLNNPFLPQATPITRRELWFDPIQIPAQ